MRKNSARKWLHATLDLLPVILIPVFMVYSHRHDVTTRTDVEIDYKYQSNDVNSVDDLIDGNVYSIYINDLSAEDFLALGECTIRLLKVYEYDFSNLGFSYDEIIADGNGDNLPYNELYLFYDQVQLSFYFSENVDYFVDFIADNPSSSFTLKADVELIDFSSDYGYYVFSRSDFNVINDVIVEDSHATVMNAFIRNFNATIRQHFNMGNIFNLNDVYEWFNTNIFHGNAPEIFFSIWNIVLYEFVLDLLFLLYGLFMFFIDTCTNLMDRFYGNLSGRR